MKRTVVGALIACFVSSVFAFQDSDGDKIPDQWEQAFGLNEQSAADAPLDFDLDGRSNLNEYLMGSNPHQADQDLSPIYPLYWDGIVNGWQDYSATSSWQSHLYLSGQLASDVADDLRSTDVVYQGNYALRMEPSRWRFFSLVRKNVDISAFEYLEFYIHGGDTGGQTIKVGLQSSSYRDLQYLGNVLVSDYVDGGAIVANEWRRVRIPLSQLHNGEHAIARINIGWPNTGTQEKYYLDSIQLIPYTSPSTIAVSIDTASQLHTVDEGLYGSNGAYWANNMHQHQLPEYTAAASISTVRYPGGSLSDQFHFRDWLLPTVADWITTPDDYVSFLSLSNTKGLVTTNFGTGTAAEAADFVNFMNVENNTNTVLWEVGNEIYGSWETTWTHDGQEYMVGDASHDGANDFCTAMKAVDSSIDVSMVGTTSASAHNQFAVGALSNASTCFDYYTFHYYAKTPYDYEYYGLLSSGTADIPLIVENINSMITQYGNNLNLKLALTEYNSYSSDPKFLATEVVNMLFLADVLGQSANAGVHNANNWFLGGSGDSSYYDLLAGIPNYTRRPSYYVFPMLASLVGDVHETTSNISQTEISFYAATDTVSNELNIVAINKTDDIQAVSFNLPAASYQTTVSVNVVEASQLNDVQVSFNGQLMTSQDLTTITPLSTVLQANSVSYNLPPLSISRFTVSYQ